jgi:hypothetical protein
VNNDEQILAQFRDTLPRYWMAVYQGCLQAGFDERQAFTLLQTYILAQNSNGIRPSDGLGPKNNSE